MKPDVRFHVRAANAGAALAIGPGKVALLEAIAGTGSISAAARALKMSYRRAWLLVDETNRCLAAPAVTTATGGNRGGGAVLTPAGIEFVRCYRDLEREAKAGVTARLSPLLRSVPRQRRAPRPEESP
jgi:molybdate transport system regulatory protein